MGRTDDIALLMGRMLIAALLLPAGVQKALGLSKFAASLKAKGVPFSTAVAGLDVAIEVIGPIALLVGLWPQATALVLIGFTLVTTWTTYKWGIFGSAFRSPQLQPQLFKSMAVLAGLAFYYVSGPGAWSRNTLRG